MSYSMHVTMLILEHFMPLVALVSLTPHVFIQQYLLGTHEDPGTCLVAGD